MNFYAMHYGDCLEEELAKLKELRKAGRLRVQTLHRMRGSFEPSGGAMKMEVRQEIDRLETEALILDLLAGRLKTLIVDVKDIGDKLERVPEELRTVKEIEEGRMRS